MSPQIFLTNSKHPLHHGRYVCQLHDNIICGMGEKYKEVALNNLELKTTLRQM